MPSAYSTCAGPRQYAHHHRQQGGSYASVQRVRVTSNRGDYRVEHSVRPFRAHYW